MTERKTEDYGRTLRRRLWHAVGLTALGLVGMIVSVMLLPGGLLICAAGLASAKLFAGMERDQPAKPQGT